MSLFTFGTRPKPGSRSNWDNRQSLISLGRRDHITIGDSFEGIAILGGIGSGKTSASGYQLSTAMLRQGYGALVLVAKVDEVNRWRRLAAMTGRQNDLVIFDEEHQHAFNFMSYIANRQSKASGYAGTLIMLLEELAEGIERMSGLRASRGDEQFWKSMNRLLAGNTIELCQLAVGQVSVPYMLEIIRDAPKSLQQSHDPEWQQDSVTYQLIERAKAHVAVESVHDLREIEYFFRQTYPALAEKTRSIIEANILGVLNNFGRGMLARLFCKGTTVSPDDIIDGGKIVVVNLPIKQFYGIGLLGQTIWKIAFQQRAEQRSADEIRPCVLYIDEAQNFLGIRDMHFAATARSSRVANLWLTQNYSNVLVALGGDESGKAAADSLLGLAMTKIFHSNSDPITNQWASDLIGKRKIRLRSSSITHPPQHFLQFLPEQPETSSSSSQTIDYIVQPHEFSMLQKGGRPDLVADAIVVQSGRRFKCSGDVYCRVRFQQGF